MMATPMSKMTGTASTTMTGWLGATTAMMMARIDASVVFPVFLVDYLGVEFPILLVFNLISFVSKLQDWYLIDCTLCLQT